METAAEFAARRGWDADLMFIRKKYQPECWYFVRSYPNSLHFEKAKKIMAMVETGNEPVSSPKKPVQTQTGFIWCQKVWY
ncbi:hypothetical protein [Vibrio aerogenes]|uniref:hypothetical protein n=1 Tax=Vibrio aerogenes TaxID=92172 RepID=UPI001114ADFD|nr:hypothetical protein [Vibrio aerogenes]